MCKKLIVLFLSLCVISSAGAGTVSFDFENGNDHRFDFWSAYLAWPTDDDPTIAGDESITGVGGAVGLPDFGVAWTVGPPNQFDGQAPAIEEGCHVVNGVLEYGPCNDPFGVFDTDPPSYVNSRGQSSYLNTYNLSQWGDDLHSAVNDQIATSPAVLLDEGSVLTVWTQGGGSGTHAPEYDNDPIQLYTDGSSGIAVLSAESDDLYALLAAVHTQGQSTLTEYTLDLSAFAGKCVFIEVVDAFAGAWGWLVVDEIQITNATVLGIFWDFENGNDHGFTLSSLVPATPAPDDPNIAGDESVTGVGGDNGLPNAGHCWTIGTPGDFEGLLPAFAEGCHIEGTPGGVLQYGPCNDPFDTAQDVQVAPFDWVNPRGQSGYLNTYALSMWGDDLHSAENDQIATSPVIMLYGGATLNTWTVGNNTSRHAPELEADPANGYTTNSAGIAVLSADDGSLLASLVTESPGADEGMPIFHTLDLSEFAGQKVIIECVDAFSGGWGWLAFDEIQITNAQELRVVWDFENGNDHGFTLSCTNPATPAADDPAVAGDEALTGGWDPDNPNNLPQAGMVWEIGTPNMNDGLLPGGDPDHARTDANGLLDYAGGTDRFLNHDHGFLNTFSLNYHGDYVHDQENDQIATSPTVMLYEGAMLTAITVAGGADHEPELDPDPNLGYTDGSGGIAVRSAADGTILASMVAQSGNEEEPFTLDLSAFAGQEVYIEVVDAHEGGWGWFAVDSIVITNAQ